MKLHLPKNARMTPAVRAELAANSEGTSALARRYHIGRGTARKWKNRIDTLDRSHTAHRLQTTMNSGQEAIAVCLRQHRLTRPRTPQTNGRVERFNGRIADILKTGYASHPHLFNNEPGLNRPGCNR
jgi:transposase InsO family protein